LAGETLLFSVQVFQEFYVQAMRRTPEAVLHDEAVQYITSWMRFPVQEQTKSVLTSALQTRVRFQISYWDAAIIEAAKALGCRAVLSEDLNAGQDYGGVYVINPFVHPI
jgi:predicted nucleic acid-binding protein